MKYFISSLLLTLSACFLMISPVEAKTVNNPGKDFMVKNKVVGIPPGHLKANPGLKIGHTIGGTRGLKVGHDPFRLERLFTEGSRGLKIGQDIGGTRGLKVGKDIKGKPGLGPR